MFSSGLHHGTKKDGVAWSRLAVRCTRLPVLKEHGNSKNKITNDNSAIRSEEEKLYGLSAAIGQIVYANSSVLVRLPPGNFVLIFS